MNDENAIIEEGQTPPDTNKYLEAIQTLKNTTVSKDEYRKLKEENQALLNSILNGQPGPSEETKQPTHRPSAEIAKELFGGRSLSNLEYTTKALELREAVLAEGGVDPFTPQGVRYQGEAGIEQAERVADVLQQCVDESNGDSSLFTAHLQSRLRDIRLPGRR